MAYFSILNVFYKSFHFFLNFINDYFRLYYLTVYCTDGHIILFFNLTSDDFILINLKAI